jgi:adenylate kinase family enzyme
VSSQLRAQLPRDARRVVVRGTSGSGKTTLAKRIADVLGVPHLELDSVFHQADWTPLDDDAFRSRINELPDELGWAVCGNYSTVAPLLLERADTVVLYDLPRRVVMTRVISRTLRRLVRREVLWNGNRERFRNLVSLDPEQSIIVWAWTTYERNHELVAAFVATPPRADLRLVHVTSIADERYLYSGISALAAETVGV